MARTPTVLLLPAAVMLFAGAAGTPDVPPDASFPVPASWPSVAAIDHVSETVGPGVVYDRWRLQTSIGPLVVHRTTVDLRDPNVSLSVVTHHDAIVGPDEALSAMADRARAEAGINADYFDIEESGAPLNIVAIGGRILHDPDGAAALVVGPGNAVSMGPVTLRASIVRGADVVLEVRAINSWSKEAGLALLTPEFGASDAGADLAVVLDPVAPPAGPGAYRVAFSRASVDVVKPLRPGQLAIVARGAEQVGRLSVLSAGDAVSVRYDGSPSPGSIVSAAGGGPLLLRDGAPALDPVAPAAQETNVRYPVTGAGLSADGGTLWLVAVDGRAPLVSVGITRPMLGSLLAAFGARQAMAFDSGGSTEMAIRHLGDAGVSVANAPSDGRERSIADALVVLNAESPGPAAQLLLRAEAPAVLTGSRVRLHVAAIDAGKRPVAIDSASVTFEIAGTGRADIDGQTAIGRSPGAISVTARAAGLTSAHAALDVVGAPDSLSILGYARDVPAGGTLPLTVAAATRDGRAIAVDPSAVTWSSAGDGTIGASGSFGAGRAAGIATVTAQAGGVTTSSTLLVGEHAAPMPKSSWRFAATPETLAGGVDDAPAPEGRSDLHLRYDFSIGGAVRAAYAQTELPVDGQPIAFGLDVYGDGNGEWLRGAYRNADGIVDAVTLARHVDWYGWRTLRVAMPPQARWPIVWTRLYAVEARRDAIEAGDLWFRGFTAFEPGPAPSR